MKRRDFLVASAGLAGSAVPLLGRAQVPCPLPTFGVQGGTSASNTCPTTGTAPSWFVNMPDKTWSTPVANTLSSVKPNPLPAGNTGHVSVCNAWTGGAADQDRGEFVLGANGGHTDYAGNEVYVCALREESPAWQRIADPSSSSAISSGTFGKNSACRYGDGRPSSTHTYNRPCFGGGRYWLAGIDSEYSASGWWSTACYSFDRSTSQWTYHGQGIANPPSSDSDWKWLGGSAAYDRVGKRVWSIAQFALSKGAYSVDADPTSPTFGQRTEYNFNIVPGYSWSVIAHDLRLWVVGGVNGLYTLNLNSPSGGFDQQNTTGSSSALDLGVGAVYHQPSRAILCWDGYGAQVRKLAIPNPVTGSWAWSAVQPSGSNAVTPSGSQANGTYGRFNIIEDMGNGQSALCIVNSVTGPTYVYKVPPVV